MIDINIADNIAIVKEQIASACARVNRNETGVTLVAVSKTQPESLILDAIDAGLTHFGENRLEEAQIKVPAINQQLETVPTWHFIGHIQSRKTKDVVPLFDVLHSIDRLKIARKLSDSGQKLERTIEIMLEINISGETAKYGFEASNWKVDAKIKEALWKNVSEICTMPHLNIRGLMTMAPFYDNMEDTRPIFAGLAELRDELQDSLDIALPDLSMGMTNDFPVAIEEGATIVRVGRAIFGQRR